MTPSCQVARSVGGEAQPAIRATQVLGDLGMRASMPLTWDLVDHRAIPWRPRRPIIAPREGGIDDHAVRHEAAMSAWSGSQSRVRARPRSQRTASLHRIAVEGPRVGIDQQLRVETMALFGLVRTVHAIPVELAGSRLREIAVPAPWSVFSALTNARRLLASSYSSKRHSSTPSASRRRSRS